MRYRFLRFPGGKLKAVTFSYDDGVRQDLRLIEILKRHGIKCSFNINSGMFDSPRRLSAEEVKKYIYDEGYEITVHGDQHVAPAAVTPIDCIKDALNCRLALESLCGSIIRGMVYPDSGIRNLDNGNSYETVRQCMSDLGFAYARTARGDNDSFRLPDDFYAWQPTAHHNHPQVFEWIDKFNSIGAVVSAAAYPRLFYLWGHSYEFDNDNNWDRIEKICATLGGRDDVWYATSIEIYDYVKAYRSLVISADGRRVYNPTLINVWFSIDGNIYEIAPGETIMCN